MSDTFIPKTPPGMPSPWERMWGSDKPPAQARKVETKQAAAPDNWDEINKRYAQGQGDREKDRLALLQNELASATNPRHKAILQREISRVGVTADRKAGSGGDPNMTSDDKYIQNLFTKAKQNPDFKEMYDFLGDDMPVVKARYLGDSTSGEFATNVDSSGPLHKNGEISMGYGSFNYKDHSTNDNGLNTFVHETAHATDRKIRLLANQLEGKKDLTPTQKQFLDTYEKIGKFDWNIGQLNDNRMGGKSVISNVVKAIAPQWFDKENNYRSSARELVGFGVGNSSVPKGKGDDKSPSHVDPTVASMFFILLDQAKKVQKELKK